MDTGTLVSAYVSNANEIRVTVTAEMALPTWKEIVKRIEGTSEPPMFHYGPIRDLMLGIKEAIREIERRTPIYGTEKLPTAP